LNHVNTNTIQIKFILRQGS